MERWLNFFTDKDFEGEFCPAAKILIIFQNINIDFQRPTVQLPNPLAKKTPAKNTALHVNLTTCRQNFKQPRCFNLNTIETYRPKKLITPSRKFPWKDFPHISQKYKETHSRRTPPSGERLSKVVFVLTQHCKLFLFCRQYQSPKECYSLFWALLTPFIC